MTDTQKINWQRLLVEAAAIVISIIIAFAIDAWWDERQERIFEQEALVGLRADYLNHRDTLTSDRTQHLSIIQHVTGLMDAGRKGVWDSDEFSILEAITLLWNPTTTDLGNGVRDSLISAGNIEIIRDEQLRYELSDWDSAMDELTDDQNLGSKMVMEIIIPYLTRSGISFKGAIDTFDENPMPLPSDARLLPSNSDAITRLLSDPEFRSILEIRHELLSHALGEYDTVIAAADSILDRIEMSLAD